MPFRCSCAFGEIPDVPLTCKSARVRTNIERTNRKHQKPMPGVPARLRPRRRKAALLDALRARIGAIEHRGSGTGGVLPFGVEEIDSALPWGGLPLGGLHEVVGADGAAAGFCAVVLGRLCAYGADGGRGVALWCLGPALSQAGGLYGPGLAACGLGPDRLVVGARLSRDRRLVGDGRRAALRPPGRGAGRGARPRPHREPPPAARRRDRANDRFCAAARARGNGPHGGAHPLATYFCA